MSGTARAKPGQGKALEERLLALVAPTRREPGVLAYHVHRDGQILDYAEKDPVIRPHLQRHPLFVSIRGCPKSVSICVHPTSALSPLLRRTRLWLRRF
jgi:Antibiotic biosynthesis monooxygenase